jgi:hypothetical protein
MDFPNEDVINMDEITPQNLEISTAFVALGDINSRLDLLDPVEVDPFAYTKPANEGHLIQPDPFKSPKPLSDNTNESIQPTFQTQISEPYILSAKEGYPPQFKYNRLVYLIKH